MDHSAEAKRRILWQYRQGERYAQWIDTIPSIMQDDIEEPAQALRDVLDIENAQNWQLDLIGELVGQRRDSQALQDDDVYRVVIRAKIARNNSDVTIDGIRDAISFVAGDAVIEVIDGLNMSFTIVFQGPLDDLARELLLSGDALARPQGVRFSGFVEPTDLPKFGVDGLDPEEPADFVEGYGELNFHILTDENGDIFEAGDGTIIGGNDINNPLEPDDGGQIAEVYQV